MKPMPRDEVARALRDCPLFSWRVATKATGRRGHRQAWFRVEEALRRLLGEWSEAVPDLDDDGTAGALVPLVAEHGLLVITVNERGHASLVHWGHGNGTRHEGKTLGEALARALLDVAPKVAQHARTMRDRA